jgi:hypothetical protein
VFIDAQLVSRHGAFHKRTGGPLIAEKCAATKRLVSRLIRHLLPAAGKDSEN